MRLTVRLAPNRATNRASVSDLGFRGTTDTALPPSTPRPAAPISPPDTAVPARSVPASWDKQGGSCCWFLISGFPFRLDSVFGCGPSCRWGEPSCLVGDRSGTNSARPLAQRRDRRQKARSRARSSLTWGFAAPEIPSYPPSTPDPRHQIAPPGIPVSPVRAPEKRSRSGYEQGRVPLYTLHPMGCCEPRKGGSPQCLEGIAVISRLPCKPGVPTPGGPVPPPACFPQLPAGPGAGSVEPGGSRVGGAVGRVYGWCRMVSGWSGGMWAWGDDSWGCSSRGE